VVLCWCGGNGEFWEIWNVENFSMVLGWLKKMGWEIECCGNGDGKLWIFFLIWEWDWDFLFE